ncbi:MAG: ATP-binding cassette domain-containing protein [Anaerolineaceae bacterium]|nr:ATP-binding cassette domain-containing protein [Anaerolineaceae bacterium]
MSDSPILTIKNITKRFGGVLALNNVSFDIQRGEILGLLGANGAGKSTLLKIMGGVLHSDSGEICLDQKQYHAANANEARQHGLISVYQELNLFLNMTVAENMFLGREPKKPTGLIDWEKIKTSTRNVLSQFDLEIPVDMVVQNLSVAQRHLVEIVRAMNENPRILMLDEPTAALSDSQIKWLFIKIRELVAAGTTVIYVSHRLEEIIDLCDRCVVLKDGCFSAMLDGDFDQDRIIQAMIGRKVEIEKKVDLCESECVVFSCRNLSEPGKLYDISFDTHKGEILGVAGLMGSGRTELLRALYGIDKSEKALLELNGKPISVKNTADAIKNGMVLVSEDRKSEGLFLLESVVNNLTANIVNRHAFMGFVKRKAEAKAAQETADSVRLSAGRLFDITNKLSGGNQQKVVLGKALITGAQVLMLDEPTRGVDVGARADIYRIIQQLADEGKSIILVSSDWEELLALSDRVIVMAEGRITAELCGDEISEDNFMRHSSIANVAGTKSKSEKPGIINSLRDQVLFANSNAVFFGIFNVLLIIMGSMISQRFLTPVNLRNMFLQSFVYILLSMGQLFVVISGSTDLSMSATMTVAGVIGLTIANSGIDRTLPALTVMLLFGVLIGVINGTLILVGKMNPLIATFGISIILQGVSLIITPRPLSPSPDFFKQVFKGTFLGFPLVFFIGIFLFVVISIVLKHTPFGRRLFAVGENSTAAAWSGLRVTSTKYIAFISCSLMAVMASWYMYGRSGAAESIVNTQMALDSIAYALIGGASFSGGKGSLGGTVLSIFSVVILMNILNQLGVGTYAKDVIKGALLVSVVVLNEYRSLKAKSMVKS